MLYIANRNQVQAFATAYIQRAGQNLVTRQDCSRVDDTGVVNGFDTHGGRIIAVARHVGQAKVIGAVDGIHSSIHHPFSFAAERTLDRFSFFEQGRDINMEREAAIGLAGRIARNPYRVIPILRQRNSEYASFATPRTRIDDLEVSAILRPLLFCKVKIGVAKIE